MECFAIQVIVTLPKSETLLDRPTNFDRSFFSSSMFSLCLFWSFFLLTSFSVYAQMQGQFSFVFVPSLKYPFTCMFRNYELRRFLRDSFSL